MRLLLSALLITCGAAAQQPDAEEGTRQLWNTAFQDKRPTAPAATKKASPAPPAAKAIGESLVGVTFWLLRDSHPQDDKAIRVSSGSNEYTPVRIEAEKPLSEGQRVRIAIESARSGYLYVIDREQYRDGTFGAPTLIFPTLRTRGGDNEVRAGKLIEIPAIGDNPLYFTIRMSRPDQAAEVLTILVAPKPLPEVKVGRGPVPLTVQQVEAWEKQWGAKVERLEARKQLGQSYTRAEKEAAAEGTRLLTHDEPLPQTMYKVDGKPGAPLMFKVPLKIQ